MPEPINDNMILSVIDKGLDAIGSTPKQAIWSCLEKDHGINQTNVTQNLEKFILLLEKFFGIGYNFLDTLFRLHLQNITQENLEGNSSFLQCVEALRLKATKYDTEAIR